MIASGFYAGYHSRDTEIASLQAENERLREALEEYKGWSNKLCDEVESLNKIPVSNIKGNLTQWKILFEIIDKIKALHGKEAKTQTVKKLVGSEAKKIFHNKDNE